MSAERIPRRTAELVVDARARLGESPIWDPGRRRVLWVDILGRILHELDPAAGTHRALPLELEVTAIALRAGGGLIAATSEGFTYLDDGDGAHALAAEVPLAARCRTNDGKCDRRGRFWAGTMSLDEPPADSCGLFVLQHDGRVTTALEGVAISNGLDWDPADRLLYYVDSARCSVDRFAFDAESGTIAERRTVVAVPRTEGLIDGLCVDREGFLWVAIAYAGEVRRYDPDGLLILIVEVPTSVVTSCCFGGDDLGDLYVTSAAEYVPDEQRSREPAAGGLFVLRGAGTGQAGRTYGAAA